MIVSRSAPEHRDRRQGGHLVGALEEAAPLTAPVDDVTHRSSERARRAALRVHRAQARHILARERVTRRLQREPRARSHERLAQVLDDKGNGGQAQGHGNLATEPTG